MNFEDLPTHVKREIVIRMDSTSFEICEKMQDFMYLFSYPNAERIYEERTRRIFSHFIISFKDHSMLWSEFYYRMYDLFWLICLSDHEDISPYLTTLGSLLELQILDSFESPVHPSIQTAYLAAENGHLHIIEWLNKKIELNREVANRAIRSQNLKLIELLIRFGLFPTSKGLLEAVELQNYIILNLFAIRGYLPPDEAADWAAKNNNIRMMKWCSDHMLYARSNPLSI